MSRSLFSLDPSHLLLLLLGAASTLLTGCESQPWQRTDVCQEACTESTCGNLRLCTASTDCPIGTGCTNEACRPLKTIDAASNALVKGFSSDALELNRGEQGEFSVEAPKAAVNVSCGLFIGPPTFDNRAITNITACVVRYHVFPLDPTRTTASVLKLRLDDLEKPEYGDACPAESALKGPTPLVESLRLGCWATSLDRVVAASQLVPLAASELPEYGVTPLGSCDQSASPTDGSYCIRTPQIGTCKSRKCQPTDSSVSGATGSGSTLHDGCTTADDGVACQLGSPGRGRCYSGMCLDQSVLPPLVSGSCAESDSEWSNCFPSPLGLFGTCFKGLCRQRCHDDVDCNTGEACEHPAEPSYLGVCKGALEQAR